MKPVAATISPSILLPESGTGNGMNGPDWRRWTVSTAAVGLLHAGLLTAAAMRPPSAPPAPPPPVMMIDLAPLPPPPTPKVEPPSAPEPVEAKPKPRTPPPRQVVEPQPLKPSAAPMEPIPRAADVAPAPPELESTPPEPTASPPPPSVASAPASNAARLSSISSWQRALQQHLQSRKHYPRAAQSRRQEGAALIRFMLDRQGNLLSARLERSSGAEMLDEEALDLVHRAQPLPPPPPEVTSERIEVTIPIEFMLQ